MLINGIPQTSIEINDRALAYGDGLFETIRLHHGQPLYLTEHINRLKNGCHRLGIKCSFELLIQEIQQLSNQFDNFGVLKIIVSRGSAGRGYRPAVTCEKVDTNVDEMNGSKRILSLHKLPDYSTKLDGGGIKAFVCQQRLGLQPSLAGIKHLNRLEQVLASQEWPDESFMEGIMLDLNGNVIEGTKSNIFFAEGNTLFTPNLNQCGVEGIMRQQLRESYGASLKVETCSLERLFSADEVFVTNSVFGVWPILSLTNGQETAHYSPARFSIQSTRIFNDALSKYSKDE